MNSMSGIDFVDSIVVRRTVEKGTKVISEKVKPLNWAGKEFKEYEQKRLEKVGDIELSSGKGTKKILLSSMPQTQIPELKGHVLVSGRGTNVRIG